MTAVVSRKSSGRGIIVDTANKTTVLADTIFFNKKNESFLALRKAAHDRRAGTRFYFIAADTLFSARLLICMEQKIRL
jgi:hypothetical protein